MERGGVPRYCVWRRSFESSCQVGVRAGPGQLSSSSPHMNEHSACSETWNEFRQANSRSEQRQVTTSPVLLSGLGPGVGTAQNSSSCGTEYLYLRYLRCVLYLVYSVHIGGTDVTPPCGCLATGPGAGSRVHPNSYVHDPLDIIVLTTGVRCSQ
jgi:hypothetical protein